MNAIRRNPIEGYDALEISINRQILTKFGQQQQYKGTPNVERNQIYYEHFQSEQITRNA